MSCGSTASSAGCLLAAKDFDQLLNKNIVQANQTGRGAATGRKPADRARGAEEHYQRKSTG